MKMRLILMPILGILFLSLGVSAQEPPKLKTQRDALSYAIGVEQARNFRENGIDVDPDLLMKGMKDVFSGTPLLLGEVELKATITSFRQALIRKRAKDRTLAALDNKTAGDAFLAENKTKEGVIVLTSGMQYKILKTGEGRTPVETDTVVCNYRGTLIDGTEFDSSYRLGKPAVFELKTAIPGLREALKLMPTGSKWQLFIPPELAYAQQGAGRYIGPNETLIFEVELLSITDKPAAADTTQPKSGLDNRDEDDIH